MSTVDAPEEDKPRSTSLSVNQEILNNSGTVFGVYVRGDNVTIIQGSATAPRPTPQTPPYKFLAPYAFDDALLFKGRERYTEKVLQTMDEQQVVVLWGKAGIGKTSLVNAGIMPVLAERQHARVVYLNSYNNPLESIRKGVPEAGGTNGGSPPPGGGLQAIARSFHEKTGRPLVLLLDQFELLFADAPDPQLREELSDKRKKFIDQLVETLDATTREVFSLLIVVDELDINRVLVLQSPARKRQFQAANIQLPPLTRDEARAAILEPLNVIGRRGLFKPGFVNEVLLPDLVSMGDGDFVSFDGSPRRRAPGGEEECIYPPYLQIVCHTLYQMAKDSLEYEAGAPYVAAQGAAGIFAGHVETSLKLLFTDEEDIRCAKDVLVRMTDPVFKGWVAPERLGVECTVRPGAPDIFETLARGDLLSERTVTGVREYMLPSPATLKAVRDLWGSQQRMRFAARDELEHLYASWLLLKKDRDEFASAGQLRFLAKYADQLPADPVRALLLLRSAVARSEPTRPWLDKLRQSHDGEALIERLEDPAKREHDPPSSVMANAKLLLGMTALGGPEQQQTEELYQTVAKAAVSHPSPTVRETAAVSLLTLRQKSPVAQVNEALKKLAGWRMKARRVELCGAMREADPSVDSLGSRLTWSERRLIFLWTLRRKAHQSRALRLAAGGALGVGLAYGLARGLIDQIIDTQFIVGFIQSFPFGAIFGGLMAFGLAMLKPWKLARKAHEDGGANAAPSYKAAFVTCAAIFGLAHASEHFAFPQGDINVPLKFRVPLLGMGFVAGLGVSWAVAGDLLADGTFKARWHAKYLGGAALVFLLVHIFFVLTADSASTALSLLLVNNDFIYSRNLLKSIQKVIGTYGHSPIVYHYFVAIDSALTGLAIAAGLKFGLSAASKSIRAEALSPDGR